MSRTITEIYNKVLDLYNENDLNSLTGLGYVNYSGDSQLISNDFLIEMFRKLLVLIDHTAKDSAVEPYASSDVVVFDSGWWGLTPTQNGEIRDYFKQGFGTTPIDRRWNLDKTGSYVQSKVAATNAIDTNSNIIYNGELVSISGTADRIDITLNGQFNDRYRLTDFPEIVNGDLFDPSLIKMETREEIDNWFIAYDGVLSVLEISIFAGDRSNRKTNPDDAEYQCTMAVDNPIRPTSDLYKALSSFSQFDWFDDNTGASGEVVEQFVRLDRGAFPTAEAQVTRVYSEDVTFEVSDGEGGFDTVTLSTDEDGIAFGDSLTTLYNLSLSLFTNTFTATTDFMHDRSDTTQTVLETDYDGGFIQRMGDGFFEVNDKSINLFSNINANDGGYSFIDYINFTAKTYSKWSGSTQDVVDAGTTELETNVRNGDPDEYSITDFDGIFGMLDVDIEGDFLIGLIRTIDKSILDDRVTTHVLTPPN